VGRWLRYHSVPAAVLKLTGAFVQSGYLTATSPATQVLHSRETECSRSVRVSCVAESQITTAPNDCTGEALLPSYDQHRDRQDMLGISQLVR
jgi:hypothetical protein